MPAMSPIPRTSTLWQVIIAPAPAAAREIRQQQKRSELPILSCRHRHRAGDAWARRTDRHADLTRASTCAAALPRLQLRLRYHHADGTQLLRGRSPSEVRARYRRDMAILSHTSSFHISPGVLLFKSSLNAPLPCDNARQEVPLSEGDAITSLAATTGPIRPTAPASSCSCRSIMPIADDRLPAT